MKVLSIVFALATLASSAPVGAQILGNRLPTTSGNVMVDGSWHAVGRDGNGNTIYERRTRDHGNVLVQRAVRDGNGNLRIVSSRTENDNRNQRNCDYNRSTNSIGDIIFQSANDTYCEDVGNREDHGWYQVGRGRDNNSIYERRTYDRNGNLIIQRARRSNGRMTIISTRRASDNDKQWRKAQKRQEKEWKKEQKRDEKEYKKSGRGDNDDDRYYQNSRYENDNRSYGQSKGNGKSKHKHKG